MGKIVVPDNAIVGIDVNVLIYHVEHYQPYYDVSLPLWNMLDKEHVTVITRNWYIWKHW
jgi:hypothetical protein